MHVISRDFDSVCLKTKKHWNSFTSDYFLHVEAVLTALKTKKRVEVDSEKSKHLLKQNLYCHICKKEEPTMPKLKLHIRSHF